MTVHREGYSTISIIVLIGLAINVPVWIFSGNTGLNTFITITYLISLLFIIRFFRFPSRDNVDNKEVIYSPADGKIIAIKEELETEYFKDNRIRISVFMSGFNVHANWLPISGSVKYSRYHPGRNLFAVHPKSSDLNERSSVVLQGENGKEILVRQIAGILARRVVTYPVAGQDVEQGGELGFIKFGSRLDIFLPLGTKLLVQIDDKVKGKTSKIASW